MPLEEQMEAAGYSETFERQYQTTRRHISDYSNAHRVDEVIAIRLEVIPCAFYLTTVVCTLLPIFRRARVRSPDRVTLIPGLRSRSRREF